MFLWISKMLSQLKRKRKNIKTELVIFLVKLNGSLHDVVTRTYAGRNQNFASECVTFNIHLETLWWEAAVTGSKQISPSKFVDYSWRCFSYHWGIMCLFAKCVFMHRQVLTKEEAREIGTWLVIFLVKLNGSLHDVVTRTYAGRNQNFASECVTFNIHLETLWWEAAVTGSKQISPSKFVDYSWRCFSYHWGIMCLFAKCVFMHRQVLTKEEAREIGTCLWATLKMVQSSLFVSFLILF